MECHINESEFCLKKCDDRVCSKVPIIYSILSSGNQIKINNLVKVLEKFEIRIKDYI